MKELKKFSVLMHERLREAILRRDKLVGSIDFDTIKNEPSIIYSVASANTWIYELKQFIKLLEPIIYDLEEKL